MLVMKAECVFCRDKHVFDEKVVAARTTQPCRVPGVEDFALRQLHEALPGFRHTVAVCTWRPVGRDDAAEPYPFRMLAPAGERETTADAIPAGRQLCLSGRRGRRRGTDLKVGIHGPGNFLIQKGRDVSAIAV